MGKANIFIVEDDRIIAEDIRTGLIKQDFSVAGIAFSGKDALKKIEETRPDLVLMDIMLHGNMNGMEAAEYILSNFSIPVVYLTAFNDEKILDQAKLTKPYGYIIKPFEDSELRTIIEIALYKHKMEMKIKESEAWLTTTLRSIGDAVIATDPGYHIVFMNPAAVFLTGWGQKETAGKSLEEVFSVINKKTGKRLKKPARKVLHEIKTITGTEDDIVLIRKSGEEKPINFTISTIRDEKGSEIGIVLIFRDITERKKAEEALNKYHLQL
ncbi:MAG: response regulator, partial [Spirochaetes bacterium]|nr:response regulator [Spirochaetota bacterium]